MGDLLDEIHADRAGDCAVCESVGYVTWVVRESTANIVIHASTRSEDSKASPSCETIECVSSSGWL